MKRSFALVLAVAVTTPAFAQSDEQLLTEHFRALRSQPRAQQDAFMKEVVDQYAQNLPQRVDVITVMSGLQYLANPRVLSYYYDVDPGGRAMHPPEVFRERVTPSTITNTCTNLLTANFIDHLGGEVDHTYRLPTAQVRVSVTAAICREFRRTAKP